MRGVRIMEGGLRRGAYAAERALRRRLCGLAGARSLQAEKIHPAYQEAIAQKYLGTSSAI
jgi:hypothetical protein